LKTTHHSLPPQTSTGKEGNSCRDAQNGRGCFLCGMFKYFKYRIKILYLGDTRSNENIGLISLHTLFLRLHNKIALLLSKQNLFWSDDIIYHETRRILIGILQHIVYNEFLPVLIGSSRSNFGIYQYDTSVKKRKEKFRRIL